MTAALSQTKAKRQHQRQLKLQSCFTPDSILEDVALLLTPKIDSSGALSSVALVRLSKQLISLENKRNNNSNSNNNNNNNNNSHDDDNPSEEEVFSITQNDQGLWNAGLENVVNCLTLSNWIESNNSLEAAVEGIKAASVISRLLPKCEDTDVVDGINNGLWWKPLLEKIKEEDQRLAAAIRPHQLSGLKWSIDCFRLSTKDHPNFSHKSLPTHLQRAYDDLDLPFAVRPGFLRKLSARNSDSNDNDNDNDNGHLPTCDRDDENDFTVACFVDQVDFRVETIQTTSKRAVAERRQTAWQGDEHVAPFEYSGKSMQRMPWSPIVANVRDRLFDETSHYYDGCLLNLYPDGGSGMRYHIDPDQGVLWGFETVVVSIGATRRFAFRSIVDNGSGDGSSTGSGKGANDSKPHTFVLLGGDVTEMVGDCQERFQHTVKTAEYKGETAPRVSLVFKKTLTNQ
eukprot:jgi/Psemu1/630/gm1.630_g